MFRVIIIFCVLSQANLERQFQPQVHIPRKFTSNEAPTTTEYVYNKTGERPEIMTAVDNTNVKPSEKNAEIKVQKDNVIKDNVTTKSDATTCEESWRMKNKENEVYLSPKLHDQYVKAKAKCLQLKGVNASAENMKTTINSNTNPIREMFTPYSADKEFVIDNEDVRTDSRNTYNGWPYSYNGPYDYQNKNVKTEKAKDKRFLSVHTTVAPVRKHVKENAPGEYISNAASSSDPVIDNPIYGDQPFFSFVLNDYFDKHHDEDPLVFKDFSWGEEFDNGISSQDIDDKERLSRHLHEYDYPHEVHKTGTSEMHANTADKGSVTKKSYDSNRGYEKYQKGDDKEADEGLNYLYKGQRETAFKDFADSFANKFGSEGSNKNSKYMLKTNQDKGQKRKGFKRVYHKDEYLEDNEFYDNVNKNAHAEESGGSTFNVGGSQGFIQSQAVRSAGNEGNSLTKTGNENNERVENYDQFDEKNNEHDNEINRYRNIAKDAAYSNHADYVDSFRI